MNAAASKLDISFRREDPAWRRMLPQAAIRLRRAAKLAFAGAAADGWSGSDVGHECAIVLTDDLRMRELNRRWRGIDKPTDVLSFAILEGGRPPPDLPWTLGDVILSLGAIRDGAKRRGRSFAAHALHLTIHGVLHLLGYDHQSRAEARNMERLEIAALAKMGLANPYR